MQEVKPYKPTKINTDSTTGAVYEVLKDGQTHAISELEVQAGPKYYRGVAGLMRRYLKAHRDKQQKGQTRIVLRDDTVQLTVAPLKPQPKKKTAA